jgi:hypothetical protein
MGEEDETDDEAGELEGGLNQFPELVTDPIYAGAEAFRDANWKIGLPRTPTEMNS